MIRMSGCNSRLSEPRYLSETIERGIKHQVINSISVFTQKHQEKTHNNNKHKTTAACITQRGIIVMHVLSFIVIIIEKRKGDDRWFKIPVLRFLVDKHISQTTVFTAAK